MTELGKANYDGYRDASGGISLISGESIPEWDVLPPVIRGAWDAGAVVVQARILLAFDALATAWEGRHREYREAAMTADDQDYGRAQVAIGAAYRKCAEQLRAAFGSDYAAPGPAQAGPPVRYAFVEQMGYRHDIAAVREVTFAGKQLIELTRLDDPAAVRLISPESLYGITWLTEDEARRRAQPWKPAALPAADSDEDDEDVCNGCGGPMPAVVADWWVGPGGKYCSQACADPAPDDEGKDDGMTSAERDEHDDLHGFALDAADEARDLAAADDDGSGM